VVVVVLGNLGAAAAGVGAVAVEFGFGEEAGAGAGEDAERAVFQAGADGGDAEGRPGQESRTMTTTLARLAPSEKVAKWG
jgi:hypothetical protein